MVYGLQEEKQGCSVLSVGLNNESTSLATVNSKVTVTIIKTCFYTDKKFGLKKIFLEFIGIVSSL